MPGTNIFSLEGKTAVVIGGTSGIGRALSFGLATAGADVIASSRRQEQVEAAASEIERCGRETLRLCSDVRNRASLEELLAATLRTFGKVDILINCAGRIKRTPTLDMAEEDWFEILDTNLTGTLRACQVFGKPMLQRGYAKPSFLRTSATICSAGWSISILTADSGSSRSANWLARI